MYYDVSMSQLLLLYVLIGLAALFAYWYRYLWRVMLLAGILALPALLLKPLFVSDFLAILHTGSGVVSFFAGQALVAIVGGGLVLGLYERFLHPHVSPREHPVRSKLKYLFGGFILFFILRLGFDLPFGLCVVLGALTNLGVLLYWERSLFWDFMFSSVGYGLLYCVIFILTAAGLPGDLQRLWFTDAVIGITFYGLPVEELLAVFLFGALVGPVYVGLKDNRQVINAASGHFAGSLKKVVVGVIVIVGAFVCLIVLNQLLFVPSVVAFSPDQDSESFGVVSPVTIHFNRPVDRQKVALVFDPPVEGTIRFEDPVWGKRLFKTATFVPEAPLLPEQEYKVTAQNVANAFGHGANTYSFQVTTQSLPTVASTVPTLEAKDVRPCEALLITLDQPNTAITDFAFSLEPAVEVSVTQESPERFRVAPQSCLRQGAEYTLTVARHISASAFAASGDTGQEIYKTSFTTALPPSISEYSPKGESVSTTTSVISIKFNKAMNQSEVISRITLDPAVPGTWQWQGETLQYQLAEALAPDTTYTLTVPQGTATAAGGYVESDTRISFKTLGKVLVSSFSPRSGASGVSPSSSLKVTFNQSVDPDSAQKAFSISPAVEGTFSWADTTLMFDPSQNLAKDTNYTMTVGKGVASVVGGLDSAQVFSSQFRTQESSVLLSIGLDYQDKPLSCEAASLKMALAYKGVRVSETDIMNLIGYDGTVRQGAVWGDPDVAFVGDINGKQNTTGYGVHWAPIARAAGAWRQAKAFSGWSASDVAKELSNDNPVVMWGVYPSGSYYAPWTTPAGREIKAWKGEHVRTIIGFKGTVDNPTHFIFNDPITGRFTWTTKQFLSNWSTFNNSGVVVY